jgi:hypothetical protein
MTCPPSRREQIPSCWATFVTVFNVGPTGTLNLLYPDADPQPASLPQCIEPNRPLHIVDVETTPPGQPRAVVRRLDPPAALTPPQSVAQSGQTEKRGFSRLSALRRDSRPEACPAVGAAVKAQGLAVGGT